MMFYDDKVHLSFYQENVMMYSLHIMWIYGFQPLFCQFITLQEPVGASFFEKFAQLRTVSAQSNFIKPAQKKKLSVAVFVRWSAVIAQIYSTYAFYL